MTPLLEPQRKHTREPFPYFLLTAFFLVIIKPLHFYNIFLLTTPRLFFFKEKDRYHSSMLMPNFRFANSMASSFFIVCSFPSFLGRRLRFIRYPGLSSVTHTSNPSTPIFGSYSIPGTSMYSLMPKEKLPVLSKFVARSLFSLASNSLFRKLSVFFLSVILQPIALFLGTLNVLRFFVLVSTTFPPETFFRTVFAVSSGVLVPHPMFSVTFSILMFLISMFKFTPLNLTFRMTLPFEDINPLFSVFVSPFIILMLQSSPDVYKR